MIEWYAIIKNCSRVGLNKVVKKHSKRNRKNNLHTFMFFYFSLNSLKS